MLIEVDAVYQNGILKPLQPLDLAENERVVVTITQEETAPALANSTPISSKAFGGDSLALSRLPAWKRCVEGSPRFQAR
jgi:predicted DNA-binding antitoxin AbrB/MazE fold protein